ncbi:MAG: hypothetical protein KJ906_03275 [Nanoarchaeota archaeon]|nr:hypothetical protein [Nanoarchaeota archaeon]
MDFLNLIKKGVEKVKSTNSTIQLVTHNDSVTEDSEILVKIEGKLKKMKFENLYQYCHDTYGERKRKDGKTYSIPKKMKVFSVNKNGKVILAEVRGIIKHKTKKKIYEIKSKIGTIKVTEDHSLITLKDNKLGIERPDKIKFVASPRHYKFGKFNPHLNLLDFKSILPEFKVVDKHIEIKRTKNKNRIPIDIILDEDMFSFFGMWIADGSYAKRKGGQGVHISCYNDLECKKIIDRIFKRFGTEKPTVLDNGVTATIGSSTLFNLMYVLDLKGYSSTKRVPGWIFGLKENLISAFLSGYFSGDGTVSKGDINANSVSKKLLEDIQTLLLFFGIRSMIRKDTKSGFNPKHDGYKLSINAKNMKKIFKERIGFLQKEKNKKIKLGIINKSNYRDYIPIEENLIKELRKENIHKKYKDALLLALKNKRKPTRHVLSKIHNDLSDKNKRIVSNIINNDIFWEIPEVSLVSSNKENDVYDIETEYGNFICENFVLKNSDGISAAAILIYTLMHLDKSFQLSVVKKISSKLIDDINEREPELTIFTDIGSSYPKEIKKLKSDIIIIDHHDLKEEYGTNVIHINPMMFEVRGLSGSGTTYIFSQEVLKTNILAPIALVGTVGDSEEGSYFIFDDIDTIERKRGLDLYGRFSRPLHNALQYSSNLTHITDESKAIQFLAEVGINIKNGDDFRTLGDLSEEEYQKLCDSLIQEQLKTGQNIEKLFGDVWTLKHFPQGVQDVKEFSTLLNGCGRMGEGAVGIAICLGSKKALEQSKSVIRKYRTILRNSLRWVENNPKSVRQSKHATYITAGDNISEHIIGTIVSMCFNDQAGKPIFGFANAEDEIKVSVRASGIDINKIINEAAEFVEGSAGGHYQAAGARIPIGTEDRFIEKCDEMLGNLYKVK